MHSRRILKRIVETYNLVDVWRSKHDKTQLFCVLIVRRISFLWHEQIGFIVTVIIYKFSILATCVRWVFLMVFLVVCVFINRLRPKSAYWHFNTVLLNDGCFRKGFFFFWNQWRTMKCQFASLQQWRDIGKIKIQHFCIQYTCNVTREMVKSIEELG